MDCSILWTIGAYVYVNVCVYMYIFVFININMGNVYIYCIYLHTYKHIYWVYKFSTKHFKVNML